ncbi:hypothetical protein D3C86_2240060 [compost metagenome]
MAPMKLRSRPVMTTSRISGAQAAMTPDRTAAKLTQVPVESLKSSVTRPSKTRPREISAGSAKRTASPMQ